MKTRKELIRILYEHLRQIGNLEIVLWDIDIYDDGESHKAESIFINDDNIIMIRLDNGEEIDIEELSYGELFCIYKEII